MPDKPERVDTDALLAMAEEVGWPVGATTQAHPHSDGNNLIDIYDTDGMSWLCLGLESNPRALCVAALACAAPPLAGELAEALERVKELQKALGEWMQCAETWQDGANEATTRAEIAEARVAALEAELAARPTCVFCDGALPSGFHDCDGNGPACATCWETHLQAAGGITP